MDLDKTIKKRHCVRKFKTKKPGWEKIAKALEAASKAPLAGNIPTVKFVVVFDKDKIEKLAQAATQSFIGAAQYVVVVCSDPTQCKRSYGERAERYCKQQAGAAIENFLLKITEMKLASCWVGAFSDTTVKDILRIPDHIEIEAILPVGYEMGKCTARKKPNLDDCIFFNTWKNKFMRAKRKPETL